MPPIRRDEVEELILNCLRQLNLMRTEEEQFEIHVDAALFGDGSPLDSLGLVTLIFDVEEALAARGIEINLSDARAMSQTRSPYRTVASLTDWILHLCDEGAS